MKDKKEFKKWLRKQKILADKFRLSVDDLHNLYDLMYMIDWRTMETLKLNKMDKWFKRFFDRVEEICLEEFKNGKSK